MSVKCQHKNVKIVEYQAERLVWEIEDGKMPEEAGINEADLLPQIHIECRDCGFKHAYRRGSKRIPKWLKAYLDEI